MQSRRGTESASNSSIDGHDAGPRRKQQDSTPAIRFRCVALSFRSASRRFADPSPVEIRIPFAPRVLVAPLLALADGSCMDNSKDLPPTRVAQLFLMTNRPPHVK